MIKTHKRKKNSRLRGSRTAGWGFRQQHKGHGNRGGVGMAGSGKRADHKKQKARESDKKGRYFGKQGLTSRGTARKKYDKINLADIKANFFRKDGDKIDLSKHKILGSGDGFKAEVIAKSATSSAIEKMNTAGGKIVFVGKDVKEVDGGKKKEVVLKKLEGEDGPNKEKKRN